MKPKYLLQLFALLFIVSCDNNDNIVSSITNPEDLELKNQIIGGWKFSSNISHYYEDGTFIDTSYSTPWPWFEGGLDSLNVCTELKNDGTFVNIVVTGKYKIENGVLKKESINYLIDCNPLKAPASYTYFGNFIKIINDTLQLTTCRVWKKLDQNNNDIWGKWESTYWSWIYNEIFPNIAAPQMYKSNIIFNPDSTTFQWKIEGFPYTGKYSSIKYSYSPPILYLIRTYTTYEVSFNNNEMYWTFDDRPTKYVRIN